MRLISRTILMACLMLGVALATGCSESAPPPVKHENKDGGTTRPRPDDPNGGMPNKKAKALPRLDD